MRLRIVVALVALVLALGLGFAGRATDRENLEALAGLWWLVALVAGISLLPWWSRILPEVAPMPGLFQPVGRGQRWCTRCGSPTGADAACEVCGHTPKARPPRRLWGKQAGKPAGRKPGRKPAARKPRRS